MTQGDPQPSGARFVAPGERLRIWLKLDMSEDGQPADLFQVGALALCCPCQVVDLSCVHSGQVEAWFAGQPAATASPSLLVALVGSQCPA